MRGCLSARAARRARRSRRLVFRRELAGKCRGPSFKLNEPESEKTRTRKQARPLAVALRGLLTHPDGAQPTPRSSGAPGGPGPTEVRRVGCQCQCACRAAAPCVPRRPHSRVHVRRTSTHACNLRIDGTYSSTWLQAECHRYLYLNCWVLASIHKEPAPAANTVNVGRTAAHISSAAPVTDHKRITTYTFVVIGVHHNF